VTDNAALLSAMYQDTILSHYRAPHNRRALDGATAEGRRKNPLCGDEIRVQLRLEGDVVTDVAFGGRGCSIATASASMLTDAVRGATTRDALALASAVDAMLQGRATMLPEALDALRGVAGFPARHGCATMPWAALRDALREAPREAPHDAHRDANRDASGNPSRDTPG
jgi:nitrogen fixation NifU-like protein